MFASIITDQLKQLIGELVKQRLGQHIDEYALRRTIAAAVARAEERFQHEYRQHDAELASVLTSQTRFADLPSVQAALHELVTHPFHDPAPSIAVVQRSFADVLPSRLDRARIDQAVVAFLQILGQEMLYVPQLRDLYALAFQKASAESDRSLADQTAQMVQGLHALRDDVRLIAAAPPPLLAAPAPLERPRPWHNLPQRSYTTFVGRQAELQQLHKLLLPHPRSRHFIVTLDGIGGVGKSALALELAHTYREHYAQLPPEERFAAIIWASAKRTLLTAAGIQQRRQTLRTLDDLCREIAGVLEVPGILQASAAEQHSLVERALMAQRTLLIVDNLETVDDEELLTFLRELPDPTKTIVTTRHRLDIAYAIRLTGMPSADARELMRVEAANKGVTLPAPAMDDLYRRSGGVPLAIVWSIGLMSVGHPIETVLRRLGSGQSDIARFCFGESIARARGRDAEQVLLALAMFEHSVSRQMLGMVAGLGDDQVGRDDGIAELVQLSLINQKDDRFSLLPLTHSFTLEELARQPELGRALRERWAAHLIALAAPFNQPHWQQPSRRSLRRDGEHLVTLANWAEQHNRPDLLLAVAAGLASYYDAWGRWGDRLDLHRHSIEYARLLGDRAVLRTELHRFAWIIGQQGRLAEALAAYSEALALAAEDGPVVWQAETLISLSQLARRSQQFDRAEARCAEALALLDRVAPEHRLFVGADIAMEQGKIARDQGDWQRAYDHFQAARAVFQIDSDAPSFNVERAWGAYGQFAYVLHQLGQLDEAARMYRETVDAIRESGSRGYLATLLVRFATLEAQRRNPRAALEYASEALEWSRKLSLVRELAQAAALVRRLEAPHSECTEA